MAKETGTKEYQESNIELKTSITPDMTEGFEDFYTEKENPTDKIWINGRRVYRQVVNFGALPNNTNGYVALTDNVLSAKIDTVLDIKPLVTASNIRYTSNDWQRSATVAEYSFYFSLASTDVRLYCNAKTDLSSYTAYVVVEYTRTDK